MDSTCYIGQCESCREGPKPSHRLEWWSLLVTLNLFSWEKRALPIQQLSPETVGLMYCFRSEAHGLHFSAGPV